MDYPKSVPSVGLVNGKFVDENPVTGTPGSLIPAAWGNGVTQEILNVLAAAGIVPDELKADQLAAAISKIAASNVTWAQLLNKPTTIQGYGISPATPADVAVGSDNVKPVTSASLAGFDPWAMQLLGVPIPIFDHIAGVAVPPTNSSVYRYIKLTASDAYNAGALIAESIVGVAPLTVASAVISLPGSPIIGKTVSLLNTERRFVRPGVSGALEQDAFQGHKVKLTGWNPYYLSTGTSMSLAAIGAGVLGDLIDDGVNGVPRQANETRVKSIGATYYMRIK